MLPRNGKAKLVIQNDSDDEEAGYHLKDKITSNNSQISKNIIQSVQQINKKPKYIIKD
jgi:hypothetical protein